MSIETAAEIPVERIVDPDGSVVGDDDVGLSDDGKRELLRRDDRCRRLDRECWALQQQGELTVYPPFEGQEAAQVGRVGARSEGLRVPPRSASSRLRSSAASTSSMPRVPPRDVARRPADPIASRFAPICVPVGTQIVHAVRLGARREARRDRRVLARVFRRRVGIRGDFHEAANMAAVFVAPRSCSARTTGGRSRSRPPSSTPRRSPLGRPATASRRPGRRQRRARGVRGHESRGGAGPFG